MRVPAIAVAMLCVVAACTVDAAEPQLAPPEPPPSAPSAVTAPLSTTTDRPAPSDGSSTSEAAGPATTAAPSPVDPPPVEGSDALTTAVSPCLAGLESLDVGTQEPPADLLDRLAFVLASPRWSGVDRSISVWIDGYGDVLDEDSDNPLLPASNQKIFTAIGAALLLEGEHRFTTTVHRAGDDLVLVGSGDPTLRRIGEHSLEELARQVMAAGIDEVDRVIVDASHFEADIEAPGWQDYQMGAYVGPMSALMVDDNRYRTDEAYIADPVGANGQLFAFLLGGQDIAVAGAVEQGTLSDDAPIVASVSSAPVSDLVALMMTASDNEVAESLLREIGDGSTTAGIDRIDDALAGWCLDLEGRSGDGSGLGRASFRSAREWRYLLQVVDQQPWADEFRSSLAVAGQTGTLTDRFVGSAADGIVRAKTGSIFGGRSLSGYTTMADGRAVVFSVVTNGDVDAARLSRDAIDGLILALVTPLPPG